jgi:hypothetical protein
MGKLLRGKGIGQAGQGVGAARKTCLGQYPVDDGFECRDRKQLRGKAVAEPIPPLAPPLALPRPIRLPVSKIRMSDIFSIGLTASASAFGMMLIRARPRS